MLLLQLLLVIEMLLLLLLLCRQLLLLLRVQLLLLVLMLMLLLLIVVIDEPLQASYIFDSHAQCADLAELLVGAGSDAASAIAKVGNDGHRNVLAQLAKAVVHLLDAIAFPCIASHH